jgi:hypothetical protein
LYDVPYDVPYDWNVEFGFGIDPVLSV